MIDLDHRDISATDMDLANIGWVVDTRPVESSSLAEESGTSIVIDYDYVSRASYPIIGGVIDGTVTSPE